MIDRWAALRHAPLLPRLFIASCFGIFVLFWIVTSFSVKRTVRRSGRWYTHYLVLAVVLTVLFRAGARGQIDWLGYQLWRPSLATGLIAGMVTLGGLVFTLWARVALGRNWSGFVVLKEDHELITTGPYRYVRHPIYSGLFLMFLGWAISGGRVGDFIGPVLVLVLFWVKARAEEHLMIEYFGDRYREYKTRVKALVPYLF